MNRIPRIFILGLLLFTALSNSFGIQPESTMEFTVSMKQPHSHTYHVILKCDGFEGGTYDLKLPAWTPGYYRIMDYARNILDFHVEDNSGSPLMWQKTSKNTWRIKSGKTRSFKVSYSVYAFNQSVAESFLDDTRAFISPTSIFMHMNGLISHPATVTFKPNREADTISTGLDPVETKPNTFYAPDFDVLYDCPVLIGSHEILKFEVQGIPHVIAAENLRTFDREKFVSDIKRVVEGTFKLMGEIPYRHYTFIMMDQGGGGLEHLNSMAVFSYSSSWSDPHSYKRWLSFIAHEYFHLYNVKRIRPIALGPFDYDKENYTTMLWVSEGISVYYQDLILMRSGFLSREEYFENIRRFITGFENRPGHLFQSAAESSFDTWINFFSRSENSANATISYYDKGAALGLLLDFKIRHESNNKKSLDDVMRGLYQKYHKEKKRGFTDEEFRDECERAAGCSLPEIFDSYVSTVKDIDYPKYFAYAGLEIDITPRVQAGVHFGALTRAQDENLVIASVEWDSPAYHGGLSARDEILGLNGIRASSRTLDQTLDSSAPGDKLRILIARRGRIQEVEVVLGKTIERSFTIRLLPNPEPLQSRILTDWLKDQ